ncbi:MAG: hypothetical protein WDN75_21220 [Bacteroidota bacterium]
MKNYFAILVGLMAFQVAFAQESVESVNEKSTLRERFAVMKAKSQTYGDYKVIKEVVLDGVWKITVDSINSGRAVLRDTRNRVSALEAELQNIQAALKQKEASMEEITYDGTHIRVMGIPFEKATFVGIVSITVLALLALLGIAFARLNVQNSSLRGEVRAY